MIIVVSMTSQTGLYKVSKRLSQIVTFMMIQWKATNTLGLEEKASQMVLRKQLIALQQILNGLISSQTFASLMPFPPSLTTRNGCLNKTFRKRFHFENSDLSTLIEHGWNAPPNSDLISKIRSCTKEMHQWGKDLWNEYKEEIEKCRKELEWICEFNDENFVQQHEAMCEKHRNLIA